MKDRYDVIVVGAGPAGSVAARTAAERGLSVLLIEKRQEIGEPVRCAEGVIAGGLRAFCAPDPAWVCATIRGVRIVSPSRKVIELRDPAEVAYILDRKVFDRTLARQAAGAGADVYTKTRATGLFMENGRVTGVKGYCQGEKFEAACSLVIAADGVESRVAREAGIDTTLLPHDLGSCAQYHLAGVDVDQGCCELYFGKGYVPGGYVWVFPKGPGEANVGLGTLYHGSRKKPVDYLDEFVEKRFPGAAVLASMAGGVPAAGRMPALSGAGILLAGDAARLSDPVTGEGILNGMLSGRRAGETAATALEAGDVTAVALLQYDRAIDRELGTALVRNYQIKEYLRRASDFEMNVGLGLLRASRVQRFTLGEVMREIFAPRTCNWIDLLRFFAGPPAVAPAPALR